MISPKGRIRLLCSALAAAPTVFPLYVPLLVVHNLAGVAVPFATGAFVDALVAHSDPRLPFLVLAALGLMRLTLEPVLQRLLLSATRKVELAFQVRLLDHALSLPPSETTAFPQGGLIAKINRDASAVSSFLRGFLPGFISALVTLAVACFTFFRRSALLGLGLLMVLPAAFFLFAPFSRAYSRVSHSVRRQSDAAFNTLYEFFHILPFLQSLASQRRFAAAPRQALGRLARANRIGDGVSIAFGFRSNVLTVLGGTVVLGVAGWLAWRGGLPVGEVVAYQMLYLVAAQSVQGLAVLLPDLASIREGIDSASELLAVRPQPEGGIPIEHVGQLECRHVDFAYPGSRRNILDGFSVSIPPGALVGVSGANGVGKTTLLRLLIGALTPTSGTILVNGHPLGSLDAVAFRRRIGVVFQDNLLFTGTLRDNITLRDHSIGDAAIKTAIALSGVDRLAARLPQGLDTLVGNRGQALSGGERQRVAIARALVRAPDLLLLDEVTNHLDAEGRADFCHLLDVYRGQRTMILVSHDPEILRRCDFELCLNPSSNTSNPR